MSFQENVYEMLSLRKIFPLRSTLTEQGMILDYIHEDAKIFVKPTTKNTAVIEARYGNITSKFRCLERLGNLIEALNSKDSLRDFRIRIILEIDNLYRLKQRDEEYLIYDGNTITKGFIKLVGGRVWFRALGAHVREIQTEEFGEFLGTLKHLTKPNACNTHRVAIETLKTFFGFFLKPSEVKGGIHLSDIFYLKDLDGYPLKVVSVKTDPDGTRYYLDDQMYYDFVEFLNAIEDNIKLN